MVIGKDLIFACKELPLICTLMYLLLLLLLYLFLIRDKSCCSNLILSRINSLNFLNIFVLYYNKFSAIQEFRITSEKVLELHKSEIFNFFNQSFLDIKLKYF